MTEILRFWRDLSKEQKSELKNTFNVKVITYDFIKERYLESL